MSKNLLKFCAMFSLVASIGLTTACGDNETAEKNNDNNTKKDPTGCATGEVEVTVEGKKLCKKDCSKDASVCGAEEACQDSGSNKVCLPKPAADCDDGKVKVGDACLVDCSADANVCQATEECKDEGGQKVCKAKEVSMDKTAPKCSDATPPARCGQNLDDFSAWQPASVISEFAIADESCCFDYAGLGSPTNALGGVVAIAGADKVNNGIQDSINDGSFAIVLEHDGVDLDNGGDFSVYFLLGAPKHDPPAPKADGSGEYELNRQSFAMGAYPQAAAVGTLENGKVVAGPGEMTLNISLLGVSLSLRIVAVRIAADVGAKTSKDAGVFLENGKLGGILRLEDLFGAINKFDADNCSCIKKKGGDDLSEPLVAINADDIAKSACVPMIDASACDKDDQIEGLCAQLVDTVCGSLTLATGLADVDSNNIGLDCGEPSLGLTCDSFSVGATFEAFGAKIVGVKAAATGE